MHCFKLSSFLLTFLFYFHSGAQLVSEKDIQEFIPNKLSFISEKIYRSVLTNEINAYKLDSLNVQLPLNAIIHFANTLAHGNCPMNYSFKNSGSKLESTFVLDSLSPDLDISFKIETSDGITTFAPECVMPVCNCSIMGTKQRMHQFSIKWEQLPMILDEKEIRFLKLYSYWKQFEEQPWVSYQSYWSNDERLRLLWYNAKNHTVKYQGQTPFSLGKYLIGEVTDHIYHSLMKDTFSLINIVKKPVDKDMFEALHHFEEPYPCPVDKDTGHCFNYVKPLYIDSVGFQLSPGRYYEVMVFQKVRTTVPNYYVKYKFDPNKFKTLLTTQELEMLEFVIFNN